MTSSRSPFPTAALRRLLLALLTLAVAAPLLAGPPPRRGSGSGAPAPRGTSAQTPKQACIDLEMGRARAQILAQGRYTAQYPANGENVWVTVQATVHNRSTVDFTGSAPVELQISHPQHGWVTVGRGWVSRIDAGRMKRTDISYFWHSALTYTQDVHAARLILGKDDRRTDCDPRNDEGQVTGVPFKDWAEKAAEMARRR